MALAARRELSHASLAALTGRARLLTTGADAGLEPRVDLRAIALDATSAAREDRILDDAPHLLLVEMGRSSCPATAAGGSGRWT
jgi:hypothetical protein